MVMGCDGATKQRPTAAYHPKSQMASREIRAKVKIDGEAGTGPSLGIKQRGRWASIAKPADA
jgi:hypothetical protein